MYSTPTSQIVQLASWRSPHNGISVRVTKLESPKDMQAMTDRHGHDLNVDC